MDQKKFNRNESAKVQRERFAATARSLGCDEDPAHFDAALKKVARHKPRDDAAPKQEPESAELKEQK